MSFAAVLSWKIENASTGRAVNILLFIRLGRFLIGLLEAGSSRARVRKTTRHGTVLFSQTSFRIGVKMLAAQVERREFVRRLFGANTQ